MGRLWGLEAIRGGADESRAWTAILGLKLQVMREHLGAWGLLWGLTKWDRRAVGLKAAFSGEVLRLAR